MWYHHLPHGVEILIWRNLQCLKEHLQSYFLKNTSKLWPFKHALVGKFSQWRPSMEIIHKIFQTFSMKTTFSIGLLYQKHILIGLNREEDYSRLWIKDCWYIGRFLMHTFKWTTYFRLHKESSITPIWISFPQLPIHFFSKTSLYSIAQFIGIPLRMDNSTA